ncbi:SEL1-like repeat protein [Pararhodospirillum oryzae]|nr:hypothetical protein [Pararhodospirillum oryzae]
MILGPEIVDPIEAYTPVAVQIPLLGLEERMRWPDVRPSQDYEATAVVDEEDETDVPIRGGTVPPDQGQDTGTTDRSSEGDVSIPQEQGVDENDRNEDKIEEERSGIKAVSISKGEVRPLKENNKYKIKYVYYALLLTLIVLIMFLLYWFLARGDSVPTPSSEASSSPISEPVTPTPAPAPPSAPTLEQRHQAARDEMAGHNYDGAVPHLRTLVDEGYAPAALDLARYYQARDPGEALALIKTACAAGVPEAPAALADIKAALEARRDQGDEEAKWALKTGFDEARAACRL